MLGVGNMGDFALDVDHNLIEVQQSFIVYSAGICSFSD